MARCITADLLCDKYGVQVEPGGVYSPAPHWWLLVTAPQVETIVETLHLLSCLESLRTLTTTDLILCFHIIDWYRCKVKFANTHYLHVLKLVSRFSNLFFSILEISGNTCALLFSQFLTFIGGINNFFEVQISRIGKKLTSLR